MVFVTAVPSWGKRGSQQRQQDEKRQNKESKGNVDANVSACLPSSCCPHAPCPGVSLLCCCPRGSYLATAWTPKEGKGTKPDRESRSSGSFSGRPTLHPAVRSSPVLPLGFGRCQTPGLVPASPTIKFMATHTPPVTGSDGNGPVDAPRATGTRGDEQYHPFPLDLSAGAAHGEQLPGGKRGASGPRRCL